MMDGKMSKELKETTQLVIGLSHREMLDIMADAGIFCSHDRFARILIDAQRRALADRDARTLALDRMVANAESLNLYEQEDAK